MKHLGEDLDACIAGRRPSALAAPWPDLVERVKAKPALASIPAAAALLLGLAVHAAVTELTAPAAPETITAIDAADENIEKFAGGVIGIGEALLAGDKRSSESKTEYRSVSDVGRRNALPKKVLVVLADESYDQHELKLMLHHLKMHGFQPIVTADRRGKLHSRHNKSGNNGHVDIKQSLADTSAGDYFSIVLMTGDSSWKFNRETQPGKQLQQQLRKTLAMHGSIVGMGHAQSIVADKSISGPLQFEECDGLCIGDPKYGPGTVIKVVESKHIAKMASQLNKRFDEVRKQLGSR